MGRFLYMRIGYDIIFFIFIFRGINLELEIMFLLFIFVIEF